MNRIPEHVLESIRRSVDVTDLVGRYVPLRRSGKSHRACCPFHDEKTPSFHVWPESGLWKCFGCGKGGNAFSFLMEREGLTFPEAVRKLAKEAGVVLEEETPEIRRRVDRIERLREIHEWACHFFETQLRGAAGEAARSYLKGRGVLGETAAKFRLGYAPAGWDGLTRAGAAAGYDEDALAEAGLVVRKEPREGAAPASGIRRRGVYDRFRDRIVFPIADAQGRVIAFGARAMGDAEPKYLNSPETPLYTKGRHLYALHLAKDAMLKTGEGAVMEGYTDVIMAHQAGWPVAVAGLGTALTPEQARRVSRYVRRLWLIYDGDEAGLRAAERAVPAFLSEGVEARVVVLPPGSDPFDLMRSGGFEAMQPHLQASLEAFDHLLRERARRRDRTTAAGRAAATEDALRALVGVEDAVRRALYLRRLADEYGVPESVARDELQRLSQRAARRDLPPDGAPSAAGDDRAPADDTPPPPAERLLVEAAVGCPELLVEIEASGAGVVSHGLCAELLECLLAARVSALAGGTEPDARALVDRIAEPRLAAFAADLAATGDGKDLATQGRDCLVRLRRQHEAREIQEELRRAPESEEWLRKLVSHHQRRAGGPGE